jgi:uncharacterized protein
MTLPDLRSTLLPAIRAQYQLEWDSIHGVRHWARVLETGLRLAPATGARTDVIVLFALLHDACRHDDGHDPSHGPRAAELTKLWRGLHFQIDDAGAALLEDACRRHTLGLREGDVTVLTCWDADRLDLFRVGIAPAPSRLCTAPAQELTTIEWANQRALDDAFPFPDLFACGPA